MTEKRRSADLSEERCQLLAAHVAGLLWNTGYDLAAFMEMEMNVPWSAIQPPCYCEDSVVIYLANDHEKSQKNTNILFLHNPFCQEKFQEVFAYYIL